MRSETKQGTRLAKASRTYGLFAFTATIALTAGTVSCSGEEADSLPGPAGKNEIVFSPEVASTRAYTDAGLETRFEQFDEIGVFAVIRESASVQAFPSVTAEDNFMNNVKLIRQYDGSWKVDNSARFFFPEDAALDFYAYYPYVANASPDNIIYDASIDTYDLMTARTLAQDGSAGAVQLLFSHKLALLYAEIDGQDVASGMSVYMDNAVFSGTLNLTAATQAAEFSVREGYNTVALQNKMGYFCAYVPSQQISEGQELFRLNDGGEDMFYYAAADATLEAGAIKRYHIKPIQEIAEPLKLPNTYMIQPGGRITFPVAKAFAVWETNGELKTVWSGYKDGTPTAKLIWQDVNGLIPAGGVTLTGSGADAAISVNTDRSKGAGNAIVALQLDGTTVWSWHIWVSDYDPNKQVNQEILTGATSMDRNLGATTFLYGEGGAFGLHYQWGRKDPLPTPNVIPDTEPTPDQPSNVPDRTLWDIAGNEVTLQITDVSDTPLTNLLATIINPLTFIRTRSSSSYDWYSTERSVANDRWNNDDNTKGVFDPCPNGWRVPRSGFGTSPWRNLPKIEYWNYGPIWPVGGYYPSAGYRASLSGDIFNYSLMVYYWSSSPYINPDDPFGYHGGSYNFHVTSLLDVMPDAKNFRAMGMSVRCVKE